MLKDGTIIKAVSHQQGIGAPCSGVHDEPKPAKWELDLVGNQKLYLCSEHYREFTKWVCGDCCREYSGMNARCICGWIRPDRCRKCDGVSHLPLIKIMAKRGGHECHSCGVIKPRKTDPSYVVGGTKQEIVFVKCEDCVGLGTKGRITCPRCEGDPFQKIFCTNCEQIGTVIAVCKTCKGRGEVQKQSDGPCSVCKGSGVCMGSSIQWNLDRIAITDIRQESRDELWPFVGQYLCFRCANPDHFFGPYLERPVCKTCDGRGFKDGDPRNPCPDCDVDPTDRQCDHYDLSKEGGLVRCRERLSRLNSGRFCGGHTNLHLCQVCGRKLRLDEWGGRCKEHAKCMFCETRPEKDPETGLLGALCKEHREYKHFGKGIEKGGKIEKFEKKINHPENPLHLLLVEEGILRAMTDMARRADGARRRAQKNAAELRKLEGRQAAILQMDPAENKKRLLEIDRLREAIGRTEDDAEVLRCEGEIKRIEREMDEARTFQNRVQLRAIADEMEAVQKKLYDDYDVLDRNRASTLGLSLTLYRVKELRGYDLWDPKSTPEYVDNGVDREPEPKAPIILRPGIEFEPHDVSGIDSDFSRFKIESSVTPRSIVCHSCKTPFNPRVTRPIWHKRDGSEISARGKWLCPHCTTEVSIPIGDVRRDGQKDLHVVVHYPTDNRPVVNDIQRLSCEICRREVDKLFYTSRIIREKDGREKVDIIRGRLGSGINVRGVAKDNLFACWDCISPERIAERAENGRLLSNHLIRKEQKAESEPQAIEIQFADYFRNHVKTEEMRLKQLRLEHGIGTTLGSVPESMIVRRSFPKRYGTVGIPCNLPGKIEYKDKVVETEEEKKKYEAKERVQRRQRAEDLITSFGYLLAKDKWTDKDRKTMKYFAAEILMLRKEFPDLQLPKKAAKPKREVVRLKSVPPPPPSRWS